MELSMAMEICKRRLIAYGINDVEAKALNTVLSAAEEYNLQKNTLTQQNNKDLGYTYEEREPAVSYIVRRRCSCGGEYKLDGKINVAILTNPTQYLHVCDKCGETKAFIKRYPYTEYNEE